MRTGPHALPPSRRRRLFAPSGVLRAGAKHSIGGRGGPCLASSGAASSPDGVGSKPPRLGLFASRFATSVRPSVTAQFAASFVTLFPLRNSPQKPLADVGLPSRAPPAAGRL